MSESVPALLLKIKQYRPRIVSFVGKGIWLIFEKGLSKRLKGTGSTDPHSVEAQLEGNEVPLDPKTVGYSLPARTAKNAKPRKKDKNEGYGLQPYRVVHDEVVKEGESTP
jgi:TDG/mug DNA glycosylase family protein